MALYVIDNTTGAAVINIANDPTTTYVPGTALTPGHTYTWYVGSVSTNGAAVFYDTSIPVTFTIAALPAPQPIAPTNGTIPVSLGYDMPTFSWTSVTAAAHYAVYVYDNTAHTTVINIANDLGTSYISPVGLTPGHSFTWYAGAVSTNGAGVFYNVTTAQTFTLATLAAPIPAGPLTGSIPAGTGFDRPTFSWSGVTGAAYYAIVVVDDATNTVVINNSMLSTSSYTPAIGLTPGHTYTWYDGAVGSNGTGTTYDVSTPQTITLAALAAPIPAGPLSGNIPAATGYTQPTFSWSSVTGTTVYALIVVDTTTNTVPINTTNLATTTFTPSTALTPGHTYVWYAGAVSSNGVAVTYDLAAPQTITLGGLSAPVPTSPLSGTIAAAPGYDQPTFSWDAVTGASHYAIVVVDNSSNGSLVANSTSLTTTTFTPPTALTPGHNYTWYVGAVSSNGAVVAYDLATPQTFTLATLAAPVPLNPLSGTIPPGSGYDQPTFSWGAVTGANHYAIVVVDNSSNGSLVAYNTSLTTTTFTPATALMPGHNYTWYVGAVSTNAAVTTYDLAAPETFTIAPLAAPVPAGPLSGTITAASGYDQPTFSWSAVTGAAHYAIVIVDNSSNNSIVANTTTLPTTTFTPSVALTPGHNYTWYVGAVDSSGLSVTYDLQSPQTFTLAALAAPAPSLALSGMITAVAGYDQPTFSWSAVTGAAHYAIVVVDETSNNMLAAYSANVPTTTYTAPNGLTPGHTYLWYVGFVSTNGVVTTYDLSSPLTFTLAPLGAATAISPVSGTISATTGYDQPTFSWTPVTAANHYSLYVIDNTTNTVAVNTNVNGTVFVPNPALTPGHVYTWYVGATSNNGQATTLNENPQTFTLAALTAPSPTRFYIGTIAPAPNYDLPTFAWTSVTGANSYALYVVDNTTGTVLVNTTSLNTFVYQPSTPLTPTHSYTWYAGAVSTNGTVTYNLAQEQVFTLSPLATPNLIGPVGSIASTSPTFSWTASTGANHYDFLVVDTTTNQTIIPDTSLNNTFFTPISALAAGNSYIWYVAAVSTSGLEFWSQGMIFSITSP